MKKLGRFCAAVVLTLALTFSAFAGDILTPGMTTQPNDPPSTTGQMDSPSNPGDGSTPGTAAVDPLAELTLELLSILSIF